MRFITFPFSEALESWSYFV